MSLGSGSRLGPYEITAKLGEGGMGEVYRATDSRLKREVAIKVLPAAFTEDKERLARFEREAQLLAQLNHPNIAQIYGLETSGATHALVMELVPGPTLAERLESGAFSFTEGLSAALQIAQALEEAHEKGIVHRDLKPQNIKASSEGKIKVLDFGLAKAMDATAGSATDLAHSPTLMNSPTLTAVHGTQLGVILGTAAYMAPEQARGAAVDKRADIWAFGVVVYEMLCGRSLFAGPTVSDTLAGVLKSEIDWRALPPETPTAIGGLLRRCLERNPKNRLHDIADARIVIEEQIAGKGDEAIPGVGAPAVGESGRSRLVERLALGIGGLALAGLAWTLAARGGSEEPTRRAARFHILPPEEAEFNSTDGPLELSPDGQSLLFRLEKPDGEHGLAIRRLDSFDIRELPGTTRAYDAFWSGDGRSIGFFRAHLESIDATGLQAPQQLAPVRDGRGGSWNRDGILLFAPDPAGAIYRIPATGGAPVAVTAIDTALGETAHLRPSFLPDGKHFVYLVKSERAESSGVFVGALDGTVKKRLLQTDNAPRFAPPSWLLLYQNDRLVARRLDLDRLELAGEAAELANGVEYTLQFDSLPVSASLDGKLIYHQPATGQLRQTVRTDRAGKRLATIGEPGDLNLDLSPDGRRLAVVRFDPERRRRSIWIHDLERDVRFPFAAGTPTNGPVWSPDNRTVRLYRRVLDRSTGRDAAGRGRAPSACSGVIRRSSSRSTGRPTAAGSSSRPDRRPDEPTSCCSRPTARAPSVPFAAQPVRRGQRPVLTRRPLHRLRLGRVGAQRDLRRAVGAHRRQVADLGPRRHGAALDRRRPRAPATSSPEIARATRRWSRSPSRRAATDSPSGSPRRSRRSPPRTSSPPPAAASSW